MKARLMAGAFLCFGGEVLMLHRNTSKKIAPGMWSSVGGHIEPHEISDPKAACLREITEETGITAEKIARLDLRYIIIQETDVEIQMIFFFIGELTEKCELIQSGEGTLHWVELGALSSLPMTFSVGQMMRHWSELGEPERVLAGAVNASDDGISWSEL